MNTNDLYALFENAPHPKQATPTTYGGYMCEADPVNECVKLLDINYGAMGGISLYVTVPDMIDARIEFEADGPDTTPDDLHEWLELLDTLRIDLHDAYEWAHDLLDTTMKREA